MSIQQSINQMLMSAQIGAGFYAHSPAGQAAARSRTLNKQEQAVNKKLEIESAKAEEKPTEDKMTEVQIARNRQLTDIKKEQFELKPSEKTYSEYEKAKAELDYQIEQSLADKVSTKKATKDEFKNRKEIIKGGKK